MTEYDITWDKNIVSKLIDTIFIHSTAAPPPGGGGGDGGGGGGGGSMDLVKVRRWRQAAALVFPLRTMAVWVDLVAQSLPW